MVKDCSKRFDERIIQKGGNRLRMELEKETTRGKHVNHRPAAVINLKRFTVHKKADLTEREEEEDLPWQPKEQPCSGPL